MLISVEKVYKCNEIDMVKYGHTACCKAMVDVYCDSLLINSS